MKTQWQVYQELELISDGVSQPKVRFWERLVSPLRRSFANSSVRDLADKHRILLFERCLTTAVVQSANRLTPLESPDYTKQSTITALTQDPDPQIQQSSNPDHGFWWTWYDS